MNKIIVFVNSDWFFLLHIYPIVNALKAPHTKIFILTKDSGKRLEIEAKGFNFIHIKISRKGLNPFKELKTLFEIFKIYKRIKPDIVHHITIKPIIYGSVISRILNIKVINTICGLGHSFGEGNNLSHKLALGGYKLALRTPNSFHFFENRNDRDFFIQLGVSKMYNNSAVVNGVGANLTKYAVTHPQNKTNKIIIVLASRMLWVKGVRELVDAATLLRTNYEDRIEFKIYGKIDKGNPSSIPEDYLESIFVKNYIKWYGFTENMLSVYKEADVVVLPTYYREGCPMVLMEALAMGKPVITTDIPGCRECVKEGKNGFMIPVKSPKALSLAIEKIIRTPKQLINFGRESRKLAEAKFDQNNIIGAYKNVYIKMLEDVQKHQ